MSQANTFTGRNINCTGVLNSNDEASLIATPQQPALGRGLRLACNDEDGYMPQVAAGG